MGEDYLSLAKEFVLPAASEHLPSSYKYRELHTVGASATRIFQFPNGGGAKYDTSLLWAAKAGRASFPRYALVCRITRTSATLSDGRRPWRRMIRYSFWAGYSGRGGIRAISSSCRESINFDATPNGLADAGCAIGL